MSNPGMSNKINGCNKLPVQNARVEEGGKDMYSLYNVHGPALLPGVTPFGKINAKQQR